MHQLESHVEGVTAQRCCTATGGVVFEQDICHTGEHEVKHKEVPGHLFFPGERRLLLRRACLACTQTFLQGSSAL